ncbi:hypothetical protein, partial [Pseudescherichia sp.]|uniref:hypothetical protein n=1 Tax=Pseudescherichia sp. TaxID=2055881 RepID=UPI0028A5B618
PPGYFASPQHHKHDGGCPTFRDLVCRLRYTLGTNFSNGKRLLACPGADMAEHCAFNKPLKLSYITPFAPK